MAPNDPRTAINEKRLHVSVGAVCNNNCLFCVEGDREQRRVANALGLERYTWILQQGRGAEEVCFTSGEPTTNTDLIVLVGRARELGYPVISVMTNGRRLAHAPYARQLARAGVKRFYVSIHGHNAKLHDSLTRAPGSFDQTLQGLRNIAALKRFGIELRTSTVITKRNLPHIAAIYELLRAESVDQVVLNVMQPHGHAERHFDQLFPRYCEIVSEVQRLAERDACSRPSLHLVDIPRCTTEVLAPQFRGVVEAYEHYELPVGSTTHRQPGPTESESGLVRLERRDIDELRRSKRPECARCRYDVACEGVWAVYAGHFGWDEFVPVPMEW